MTTQVRLGTPWADTGEVLVFDDVKYTQGWIEEIPLHENFNYVLNNHARNILSAAEKGTFDHDPLVNYIAGGTCRGSDGVKYTCVSPHLGQDPVTDTSNNFWYTGEVRGKVPDSTDVLKGTHIFETKVQSGPDTWDSNEVTAQNKSALFGLNTTAATNNLVFGNVNGELIVKNVGTTYVPDGSDINPVTDGSTHRIFHEGHQPDVSEVVNAVEEASTGGVLYGRQSGGWVPVTTTTVGDTVPSSPIGSGTGWYNTNDGVTYIDINDGDTSQWVPMTPLYAPNGQAAKTAYGKGGFATVEDALDNLLGL